MNGIYTSYIEKAANETIGKKGDMEMWSYETEGVLHYGMLDEVHTAIKEKGRSYYIQLNIEEAWDIYKEKRNWANSLVKHIHDESLSQFKGNTEDENRRL